MRRQGGVGAQEREYYRHDVRLFEGIGQSSVSEDIVERKARRLHDEASSMDSMWRRSRKGDMFPPLVRLPSMLFLGS